MHTDTLEDALEPFIADGLIQDIVYPVKSGKEATVYCCRTGPRLETDPRSAAFQGAGLVAAKVYKPRAFRSFRDDSVYREGRVILDRRAARAAAKRTDFGHKVQSALWTNHEWDVLTTLHAAGADVPRPLAHSAGAILLEFVGEGEVAAPVLKEVTLSATEADALFERLLDNVQLWLAYNIVHGDLSAYNVLYAAGDPVVIDFPQACDPRFNPNAFRLLTRDIENLARYFERFGSPPRDAFALAERYWSVWERP